MATISAVKSTIAPGVYKYVWETLTNGDDGEAVEVYGTPDMTCQVMGTFGSGGSVNAEGSLQASPSADADFFILTDPSANALTMTSADGAQVLELVHWFRPHVTAGDGTTDLDYTLLVKSGTK